VQEEIEVQRRQEKEMKRWSWLATLTQTPWRRYIVNFITCSYCRCCLGTLSSPLAGACASALDGDMWLLWTRAFTETTPGNNTGNSGEWGMRGR
jgi:hypothetical protein